MVNTKDDLPRNTVERNRIIVYRYFDEHVIPILKERMPESDQELYDLAGEIESKMREYRWILRKYENTYRLSALAKNNYLYFMVWTPDGEEEFNQWDYEYHGSKGRDDEH